MIELAERLLSMSGKGYERAFADSPLARPRRKGMLRNLCVALGNWGSEAAVPVLARALEARHPLVRGHAAWALGRVGSRAVVRILRVRLEIEDDPGVAEELDSALRS